MNIDRFIKEIESNVSIYGTNVNNLKTYFDNLNRTQNKAYNIFNYEVIPFIDNIKYKVINAHILLKQENKKISIKRRDVLIIFIRQLLCLYTHDDLFPEPNFHNIYHRAEVKSNFNAYEDVEYYSLYLMDSVQNEEYSNLHMQKIKSIMTYLMFIYINFNTIEHEIVTIERKHINHINEPPSVPITYCNFAQSKIESADINIDKVDFANKLVGGGVLKNGCCQEEIQFLQHPELMTLCYICQELDINEAIYVTNVYHLLKCEHYGYDIELDDIDVIKKDNYIIIDAIDYRSRTYNNHIDEYMSEIQKAYTGFIMSDKHAIATGHWGCGAFNGIKKNKFAIQLIAASIANKELIYCILDPAELLQFKSLYLEIIKNCTNTSELYNKLVNNDIN